MGVVVRGRTRGSRAFLASSLLLARLLLPGLRLRLWRRRCRCRCRTRVNVEYLVQIQQHGDGQGVEPEFQRLDLQPGSPRVGSRTYRIGLFLWKGRASLANPATTTTCGEITISRVRSGRVGMALVHTKQNISMNRYMPSSDHLDTISKKWTLSRAEEEGGRCEADSLSFSFALGAGLAYASYCRYASVQQSIHLNTRKYRRAGSTCPPRHVSASPDPTVSVPAACRGRCCCLLALQLQQIM